MARDIFSEIALRNTEILSLGYKLYQLEQIYNTKGEQSFNDRRNNLINGLGDFYKDFNPKVDERVFEQLIAIYADKYPKAFYRQNLKT